MTYTQTAIDFVAGLDRSALRDRAVSEKTLIAAATALLALERDREYRDNMKLRKPSSSSTRAERKRIDNDNIMAKTTSEHLGIIAGQKYTDFQRIAEVRGDDFYQSKAEITMWRTRDDPEFRFFNEQWTLMEALRLRVMVEHLTLYEYFVAGIWDIEAAYDFLARDIDPALALAVNRG